ncbi:hypothetical protein BJ742DRAFT_557312 [Cladochytrium replicatum]|nr:hypothetical protein BJ742DRAFT_557312 [Cladochytrium replicatum]
MVQDDDAVIGFTPDEFESGINLIFYLSITIIPLNMSGSLYVLYRVASAYWNSRPRAIPASLRLPMYIVFIDLMCSFTFAAEMVHLYVMRRSPEPPFAYILGGCVTVRIQTSGDRDVSDRELESCGSETTCGYRAVRVEAIGADNIRARCRRHSVCVNWCTWREQLLVSQ